jgi:hypothetical protein
MPRESRSGLVHRSTGCCQTKCTKAGSTAARLLIGGSSHRILKQQGGTRTPGPFGMGTLA